MCWKYECRNHQALIVLNLPMGNCEPSVSVLDDFLAVFKANDTPPSVNADQRALVICAEIVYNYTSEAPRPWTLQLESTPRMINYNSMLCLAVHTHIRALI